MIELEIAALEPDENRIRGDIRDTTDIQSSIKEHGIIEPIVVRPVGDGTYRIIEGHRRWTAARIVGMTHVPVVVRDADPKEIVSLMMACNTKKPQPPVVLDSDGRIVGGMAWAVAHEKSRGVSNVEIAHNCGEKPDTIGAYLALHDETVDLRRKVASGQLSITAYSRMKRAPEEVKQLVAEMDGDVSANQVRKAIKSVKQEVSLDDLISDDESGSMVGQLNEMRSQLERMNKDELTVIETAVLQDIASIASWLIGGSNE